MWDLSNRITLIPLSVIPLSGAFCNIILGEATSYEPGLDESLVGQLEGLADGQRDLLGQLVADEDEAEKRKVMSSLIVKILKLLLKSEIGLCIWDGKTELKINFS